MHKQTDRKIDLINQIIQNRYNQEKNYLNLNQKSQVWANVLQYMENTNKSNREAIEQLNLQQCSISRENINKLCCYRWLHLRTLWLWGNNVNQSCLYLLLRQQWPVLKMLRLASNQINDNGIQKLFQSCSFPQLEKLLIEQNNFSSIGIRKIMDCSFINLNSLNISENRIGCGTKFLIKAQFPDLTELKLNSCLIENKSFQHLMKGNWKKLSRLQIKNNEINQCLSLMHIVNWNKQQINIATSNWNNFVIGLNFLVTIDTLDTDYFFQICNSQISNSIKQTLSMRFPSLF